MKNQLEKCKQFAVDNLSELAFELTEWHETGMLRDGRLRELGEMFRCFTTRPGDHLVFAERLTEKTALKHAANGGNLDGLR